MTKRICAFDIGIKNLSFCILETKQNVYDVLSWQLIDLRSDRPTCIGIKHVKGNKTECGKEAKLCCKADSNILYCKMHSKQYNIPKLVIDIIENQDGKDKMHKCEYLDGKCSKKVKYVIYGKYYCGQHKKMKESEHMRENKLCDIKKHSCMKEPLYDVGTKMYKILDGYPEILDVDSIVIENQPSMRNPTMKSISMILLCYFILHKHRDVKFVAPSGKLKINEKLTKNILVKCRTKQEKYNITKSLAIDYCRKLLCEINRDDYIGILDKSKKKDDLCDSFLHAYYHSIGAKGLNDEGFIKEINDKYSDIKSIKKKVNNDVIVLD